MKTIAAVIGVPAIRPEIAANTSRASATRASAQCIGAAFQSRRWDEAVTATHLPRTATFSGGVRGGAISPRNPEDKPFELLRAKLDVPSPRPGLVERTGLVGSLSRERSGRVVSVVAPPGYGKTTPSGSGRT